MPPRTPSNVLLPTPFVVVIDTREQTPFGFRDLRADARDGRRPLQVRTEVRGLRSGDYSIAGHEDQVAVERKSLPDLYSTIGQGRDRFERELERLNHLEVSAVVIEADWRSILDAWPPDLISILNYLRQQRDAATPAEQSPPFADWIATIEELIQSPPCFSELDPKIVFRSILTWQQRFPAVHWWPCCHRRHAEVTTFRILERYWRDAHDHDSAA